jgi:hypothetical protein
MVRAGSAVSLPAGGVGVDHLRTALYRVRMRRELRRCGWSTSVMDSALEAAWDQLLALALDDDAYRSDRSQSWVPPLMEELVVAVRTTALRRLVSVHEPQPTAFQRVQ